MFRRLGCFKKSPKLVMPTYHILHTVQSSDLSRNGVVLGVGTILNIEEELTQQFFETHGNHM